MKETCYYCGKEVEVPNTANPMDLPAFCCGECVKRDGLIGFYFHPEFFKPIIKGEK